MRFKILVLICFLMSACGGDNGNGGDGNTQNFSGIWEGQYTSIGNSPIGVVSQISSEGSTYIYFENGQAFYGLATINGNNVTIQGSLYRSTAVVSASFSGTVVSASSMSGTFQSNFGDSGTITFTFDNLYNRSASLSKLEGAWSGLEIYSNLGTLQTWEMVVSNSGHFTSTLNGTCLVEGDIDLIDELKNEYSVTLNIDCGGSFAINGDYTGIISISDGASADNTVNMAVANTQHIMIVELEK